MAEIYERLFAAIKAKDLDTTHTLIGHLGTGYAEAYRLGQHMATGTEFSDPIALPIAALNQDMRGCTRCELHKGRTQVVPSDGDPLAQLMFIGEAPGQAEDIQGKPFVGKAGALLNKMITAAGWTRQSIYIANTIKCRPPENRDPTIAEIGQCAYWLQREIELIKPKVIVCLGSPAAKTIIEPKFKITENHGKWYEINDMKCMAIYHPAYLLRRNDQALNNAVWKDLQLVMSELSSTITEG